ncbi:MAG: AAA family ATPase [Bacterioplanes sp.]|nr:AAA family ATPase [Bacterioplanes sp.]
MQVLSLHQACLAHYGLREMPFSLTPNTDFYIDLPSQKQAFELVLYALSGGEGFIKITGEVGTGKTLLCRRLLNHLADQSTVTLYLPNPALDAEGVWRAIAAELGDEQQDSLPNLQHWIQQQLLHLAQSSRSVVLLVDEAQCMPEATLEALRLISNLETERRKLLQIVLFGQPELDRMLAQPSLRQLRQRITSSAVLNPLDSVLSLEQYLQQRLLQAGYQGLPIFSRSACKAIWRASQGIPRLVNVMASKSLLVGYGAGVQRLQPRHVRRAINDTEGVQSPRFRWWYWALPATLALFAMVVWLEWRA